MCVYVCGVCVCVCVYGVLVEGKNNLTVIAKHHSVPVAKQWDYFSFQPLHKTDSDWRKVPQTHLFVERQSACLKVGTKRVGLAKIGAKNMRCRSRRQFRVQ